MKTNNSETNNIVDLASFRNQRKPAAAPLKSTLGGLPTDAAMPEAGVVDMTQRRQEILQDERREVKRTILTEFVGAFCVVPALGLERVNLYDISDNGVAFDLERAQGHFKEGEEVAMRVYLNQYTYFPFAIKIAHVRLSQEEGVLRHGAEFLKDTVNKEALHHFVKFIETVSASLERDNGDIMVSNLKT